MIKKFTTSLPGSSTGDKSGGSILGWVLGLGLLAGAAWYLFGRKEEEKPEEKQTAQQEQAQPGTEADKK